MNPKLKLYFLFIPYIVAPLCVPDVYGMKNELLQSIACIFPVISIISSAIYCSSFSRLFKNHKGTLHSLGHLFFFGTLCFLSSLLYLKIHHRSGLEGLAAGMFIMGYWGMASPLLISIVLSAVVLFFKNFSFQKDQDVLQKKLDF
jgi:asparagine N-glycosylation enzyme membrane subunit Stt3